MLDDDGAAAIRAIVDDAAAIIRTDAVETLTELQRALGVAFTTGADEAWRTVYRKLGHIVARAADDCSSSARRLRSFLRENDDLAVQTMHKPREGSNERFAPARG
jgi:hypothetical protein